MNVPSADLPEKAVPPGLDLCCPRREVVTALQVWHERIPHYEIAGGGPLVYSGNPRAPHKLPLVWI